MAEEQEQVQEQKQKQEDNFDTFPCDSFLEELIIDYDDEDYEESDSEIVAEMAEIQITETETEISNTSSKELRSARVWKHFEKQTIEEENETTETFILCKICEGHFSAKKFYHNS
ncbi:uncharacterized protein OCT59_012645 [Rhizophagus irregularis]|uniref:uncharacterized protein n=1 Tax=Rhizophagus irregularis TaxID=588596 RepID=UPI000CBA3411|nr:hypothetical protein OCT59_012645 [Rhizophagus irregularis]